MKVAVSIYSKTESNVAGFLRTTEYNNEYTFGQTSRFCSSDSFTYNLLKF